MEAIKQIIKVKNDKITIHLSPEMNNTMVEVIILPVSSKINKKKVSKDKGMRDLLNVGIWSETDIQAMEEASKKFNLWTIQNF